MLFDKHGAFDKSVKKKNIGKIKPRCGTSVRLCFLIVNFLIAIGNDKRSIRRKIFQSVLNFKSIIGILK